jgi:hypothetical protein
MGTNLRMMRRCGEYHSARLEEIEREEAVGRCGGDGVVLLNGEEDEYEEAGHEGANCAPVS